MTQPQIIKINDINYYNANDLRDYDPVYFFGCSRTVRKIITKKNIDTKNIAYGNYNLRYEWRLSSNQTKPPLKAKLLLVGQWVLKKHTQK